MRHTIVPSHQWLVVLDIEAGVVGGGRGGRGGLHVPGCSKAGVWGSSVGPLTMKVGCTGVGAMTICCQRRPLKDSGAMCVILSGAAVTDDISCLSLQNLRDDS